MTDDSLAKLGPRLRAARRDRGLTLEQLAAAAGMSASTLSRLESGKRSPGLELLLPLVRELRIGLDTLLPNAVPDPRVPGRTTERHGVRVLDLSPAGAPVKTWRMSYRRRLEAPQLRTHSGYEWVYVISGRLRLLLGEHDLVLGPGEAAEFDTRVPHAFGAADAEGAETLSIFSDDGARIHTAVQTEPLSTAD